ACRAGGQRHDAVDHVQGVAEPVALTSENHRAPPGGVAVRSANARSCRDTSGGCPVDRASSHSIFNLLLPAPGGGRAPLLTSPAARGVRDVLPHPAWGRRIRRTTT